MKIAITVADATHAIAVGGEVVRETFVIEVPNFKLPVRLKDYLERFNNHEFISVSTSLADEREPKD